MVLIRYASYQGYEGARWPKACGVPNPKMSNTLPPSESSNGTAVYWDWPGACAHAHFYLTSKNICTTCSCRSISLPLPSPPLTSPHLTSPTRTARVHLAGPLKSISTIHPTHASTSYAHSLASLQPLSPPSHWYAPHMHTRSLRSNPCPLPLTGVHT
jgi:hypothetical protein